MHILALLTNCRADAGLALVVVNHIRNFPTMLPEILANATFLPVQLITDGMPVERNHVHVTGYVDFILPPADISKALVALAPR